MDTNVKYKSIYASQRILIPRPEFFVLYNGGNIFSQTHTRIAGCCAAPWFALFHFASFHILH